MTTLYVFQGENDLQREEALVKVIRETGVSPDWRDLNTEILTAPLTPADFRRACNTIPFLGDRRIVIAREVLSNLKGEAAREVAAYLADMPPTTTLIFCESELISPQNPVLAQAQKMGAIIQTFNVPGPKEVVGWIINRTKMHGGRMDGQAAALLAQNIGSNVRLLDQEIQKLLLYCGENKTITVDDVKLMVPYVQSADVIFNMVDAIGQRNPRNAAIYLHRLLAVGQHPLTIFGMVVRQFRLLIQARWLIDHNGRETDVAARLKLHPYAAEKTCAQAERFTFEQLRTAYRLLTKSDLAIKRGMLDAEAALDLLVMQLTSL